MTVKTGTRFGQYEILAPLGAGGMGEVYRAKDSKLEREVAIKVLPADFAEDADRVRRFQQEAKVLAALNHPNVVHVYEAGEHDGAPFLVMELLEGETLRERLQGKPIPPKRAAEIAREVANGLSAAHGKGILHRDLKPENIWIAKDGRVKVLDFGLAKFDVSSRIGQESATRAFLSEPGTVVGTSGYMSPEQVRGELLDARTDIFTLGVVLWEMLTGKGPFSRNSAVETMHAILKEETPNLEPSLKVPLGLVRILDSCLAKVPDARFHSAHDLAFALEGVTGSNSSRNQTPAPIPPIGWRRIVLNPALLLVFVACLAVALGWSLIFRSDLTAPTFRKISYLRGNVTGARFMPDGRSIALSAAWEGEAARLFLVNQGNPQGLNLGVEGNLLSVSGDSEMAILIPDHVQRLTGTLASFVPGQSAYKPMLEGVRSADWIPGGGLALNRSGGSYTLQMEFPRGAVVVSANEAIGSAGGTLDGPKVSRDGRWAAFRKDKKIWLADRQGGLRELCSSARYMGMAWAQGGAELWVAEPDPSGASTQLVARSPGGRKHDLLRIPGAAFLEDVRENGSALVRILHQRDHIEILNLKTGVRRELGWLGAPSLIAFSSDSSAILLNDTEADEMKSTFYLRKLDGSLPVRLGSGRALNFTVDGKGVIANIEEGQQETVVAVPLSTGEPRLLVPKKLPSHSAVLMEFPDQQRLLLRTTFEKGEFSYQQYHVADGSTRQIGASGFSHWAGQLPLSPNGQWIAAVKPGFPNVKRNVLLRVADGSVKDMLGTTAEDIVMHWSPDGRYVYSIQRNRLPSQLFRFEVSSGRRELLGNLSPTDIAGVAGISRARISPDGTTCAYQYTRNLSDLYLIEGLK